jgi:hypothetical protein
MADLVTPDVCERLKNGLLRDRLLRGAWLRSTGPRTESRESRLLRVAILRILLSGGNV